MSVKTKMIYVCSQCGYETSKWYGKCPECGEWNSLQEEVRQPVSNNRKGAVGSFERNGTGSPVSIIERRGEEEFRFLTGWEELDRVFGGGIVKGSLVLIGGEPGIGKSTLLLQICQTLCKEQSVLYVSGEESVRQIQSRAERLGVASPNLMVLSETDVDVISNTVLTCQPSIVIIDSIQTMNLTGLSSSPGSVTQVRESTQQFMQLAKQQEISFLLVGHVNKEGAIAGPKVLEHIVDAVLLFEGERTLSYRILRATKNRYGSTNEIGVFEMRREGLIQVENPSTLLLEGRPLNVSGTCTSCMLEGTRPLMTEVQALVTKSSFSVPRRNATGFDLNRLLLLIAIIEKRAGFFLGNMDVFLNVIGGVRLMEPAADLAVLLSIYSSIKDMPVEDSIVAFGEVGLAGEIRTVSQIEQRVAEAARLGFQKCLIPQYSLRHIPQIKQLPIQVIPVANVLDAFQIVSQQKG